MASQKTKKLILIGGGLLRKGETIAIDKYIIKATKKKAPTVLFIPIASNDKIEYILAFTKAYKKLGANVDVVKLSEIKNINHELSIKILSADVIYFGGGDVNVLLKYLRKPKLKKIIQQAYNQGSIITGLSAGCVVWYDYFIEPMADNKYNIKKGLGWLKGCGIAHYQSKDDYEKIFDKYQTTGIGNNCAIHYENGKIFKIIGKKNMTIIKSQT